MDELLTALRAAIRDEVARQLAELLPAQPAPEASPELLGVEQAAARLGVQPKTLYEWRRLHKGPPSLRVGRLVKYRSDVLDEWINRPRSGDDILTLREAADYTRTHWRTIADACRAGELKGIQRTRNATWRVRREDLDTWMGVTPPVRRGPLRSL
ncbi:helix-turn-helix domain-containing protein [Curtobacterium citreum]|uniref:Helix-turn-helix domain-containing protein n=1 Tax=Curtobacterium citreum TaxID=2036 RepID=A0ABT2HDI4_9MICO|nr:helix-turn-helix domain-containing protein [Curtobacterium citreum]MCS6521312.1 helix-turn-helix domain-containing protein [Curtobacterium citreum]TQJ28169.1 excisionase family DNA binding protein [Curtobacterium citreum]